MAERALETAAAYVGAAVLFGIGVWFFMGATAGQEFFAGYLLEQSLSIDNLFVFILVFKYFKCVLMCVLHVVPTQRHDAMCMLLRIPQDAASSSIMPQDPS